MSLIFNNKQLRYPLSGSFTGSFSGSFTGDGSQLTGIVSSKWSGSNPITRNSNVEITGSLSVTEGISGSFSGSGAGLFDIPASSIIGLNLNQISSGSVSASISPNNGLQVNTNVTATSFTGSLFGTSSVAINANTASYVLNAISSSYTSTASYVNQLNQDVNISGSLTVIGDAIFYGSSSFTYVTASQLAVSASTISVNVFEPVQRFGGLVVYDSGSSQATASLLWDSLHDHFIYQNVSGTAYVGAMFLSGPRNTGSLGDEPTLTTYFIPRSDGEDHLENSQIFSSGSTHIVTGSLTVTDGVSGSFSGSGANLFGIPSSAISGLNLSQIASGSVTASVSPMQFSVVSGSVTEFTVTGTGVTIGNIITDIHRVTGSVNVSGSVIATNFTGSLQGTASFANTASFISPTFISASAAASGFGSGAGGTTVFGVTVDGQGGVILTGDAGYVYIPTARTITGWTLISDQTGSTTIDILRSGTSIIGAGNYLTLTTASISSSGSPSGWTSTTINSGDILRFNVSSASLLTRLNVFVY